MKRAWPLLALVVLVFPVAELLPLDTTSISLQDALGGPSLSHPFGTDELGRDILGRTLIGGRSSLEVALLSVSVAAVVGTVIGIAAGYFGGLVDETVMRTMDVLLSIPAILLAAVIISVAGAGVIPVAFAVGTIFVPTFARLIRASTMATKSQDYVSASVLSGSRHREIILRTILPNAMGGVVVQAAIAAATAILLEAALSFLGLGTQPPEPSWGLMLATGKGYLSESPLYPIAPGLFIMTTVIAFDHLAARVAVVLKHGTVLPARAG